MGDPLFMHLNILSVFFSFDEIDKVLKIDAFLLFLFKFEYNDNNNGTSSQTLYSGVFDLRKSV